MFDTPFKLFGYLGIPEIIVCIALSIILFLFSLSPQIIINNAPYLQPLTIIIFSVTAIITLLNFKNQSQDREKMSGVQYANLTQSKVNEIDKLFMSNPYLNRLYYQMYKNDPNIQKIVKMSGHSEGFETPEMLKAEHHASNMIFQIIADIYACKLFNSPNINDSVEWLHTFRQWFGSSILINHWKYLQYEQHPDVRKFINTVLIPSRSHFPRSSQVQFQLY
jgi:hypothetical protein